eukprot:COSAG01_NODE_4160_length_5287_cov_12.643986_2_plen_37_part_00
MSRSYYQSLPMEICVRMPDSDWVVTAKLLFFILRSI